MQDYLDQELAHTPDLNKKTETMVVSTSLPLFERYDRLSWTSTSSHSSSLSNELPEMADVPCYTCRRRHIKCDKLLPNCAKCAKKGVPCLGYQKPLRWAGGVAIRGKFKGKSKPVVDSQTVSIVRRKVWTTNNCTMQEAAHFGLHATQICCAGVVGNDASFLELISYHNNRICAEHIGWEQARVISRKVAPLSHETVRRLPRGIVNGILGNAALHMAARNLGNRAVKRHVLETKSNLFHSINRLLQSPQKHQQDVLFCCIILLFAMDVMEHGTKRRDIHMSGAMSVIASFGGIENFASYYPHLRLILAQKSYFETMCLVLSHVPIIKPKQASQRALEALCYDPYVRQAYYISSPPQLTLAVYNMGVCARSVLVDSNSISVANMYQRDRILSDVLGFQCKEGISDLRKTYFQHTEVTEAILLSLNLVTRAWKSAITILILRYLYFGLPNLAPQSQFPRSTILHENAADPLASNLWNNRYDIYNEAFSELSASFFALHGELQRACIRYVLVPLFILALVSRRGSAERVLCFLYFEEFKEQMGRGSVLTSSGARAISSPVGGQALDFDIPWDKLDAFSEAVERKKQNSAVSSGGPLCENSAPEWNWWYMLKHLDLELVWPVASGTMHMELGSEFWAFSVLSSVVTNECFDAWIQPPASS